MAKKKAGGATATRRPDATATNTPKPTIASGPLLVSAQGGILEDDDRLIIAVRVLDKDGVPVPGLKKSNFKLWQLGQLFDEASGFFVVELGEIAGLQGMYQLVHPLWSVAGNGTFPFFVRVTKGSLRSGGALTFIVKVREGLDL